MAKTRTQKHASATNSGVKTNAETTLLWKIEDAWMQDRLLGDAGSSRSLIDESYRGATSGGTAQSKAEFIKATESVSGVFTQQSQSERAIQYVGDVAVSTGIATLTGPGLKHSYRYLRVFAKQDGAWRLVASQSTPAS